DLELAGMGGVRVEDPVVAVRGDLPGHHDPVRWIAGEHPAPLALAAVHAALVVPAADARLEHGLGEVGGAAVVAGPPGVVAVGEKGERPVGGQRHGHRTADGCGRSGGCGLLGHGCGLLGHGCSCLSSSAVAAARTAAAWNEA